jgi:hypothetical protein
VVVLLRQVCFNGSQRPQIQKQPYTYIFPEEIFCVTASLFQWFVSLLQHYFEKNGCITPCCGNTTIHSETSHVIRFLKCPFLKPSCKHRNKWMCYFSPTCSILQTSSSKAQIAMGSSPLTTTPADALKING